MDKKIIERDQLKLTKCIVSIEALISADVCSVSRETKDSTFAKYIKKGL